MKVELEFEVDTGDIVSRMDDFDLIDEMAHRGYVVVEREALCDVRSLLLQGRPGDALTIIEAIDERLRSGRVSERALAYHQLARGQDGRPILFSPEDAA